MNKKSVLKTDFYDNFTCIADKCTYTCCHGWSIYLDKLHYEYYKKIGVRDLDKETTRIDENLWKMVLREDGSCPYCDETGLCELILNYGKDILCKTCQLFPRIHNDAGEYVEVTVSNACPAVLTMLQRRDSQITFISDVCDEISVVTNNINRELWNVRNLIIDLIQIEDLPLWTRLYLCYSLTEKIRNKNDINMLIEQYNSVEYILDIYKQLSLMTSNLDLKLRMLYSFLKTIYNSESKDKHEKQYHEFFLYIGKMEFEDIKTLWLDFQVVYERYNRFFENIIVNHAFGNLVCDNRKKLQYSVFNMIEEFSLIIFTWFVDWIRNDKKVSEGNLNEIVCYYARKLEHQDQQSMLQYIREVEKEGWMDCGHIFVMLR